MTNIETFKQEYQTQIRCISHEIRNHLSICDMYSQIIKRNLEKDGIKNESVENALECIQKSIQIINANLLELKSTDQTKPQIYDFEKEIIKGAELSKAYVFDKDIKFEVFVKNTASIFMDENKLLASMVNIIKNGIESIEVKGKISILAEIKNDTGIIKISNNGKPIPQSKQETIFECGYTDKKNGCGLGLHICKQYLESQNSEIRLIRSTKSETLFEIRIPIYKD